MPGAHRGQSIKSFGTRLFQMVVCQEPNLSSLQQPHMFLTTDLSLDPLLKTLIKHTRVSYHILASALAVLIEGSLVVRRI